jgi:hypothetical protein
VLQVTGQLTPMRYGARCQLGSLFPAANPSPLLVFHYPEQVLEVCYAAPKNQDHHWTVKEFFFFWRAPNGCVHFVAVVDLRTCWVVKVEGLDIYF